VKRQFHEMNAIIKYNAPRGGLTSSEDPLTSSLAELSNHENLSSVASAALMTVDGGRKSWFEMRFEFLPLPDSAPGQTGYFDNKVLEISGEIGKHVLLLAKRTLTVGGHTELTTASAYGDSRLRSSPEAISATFERPDLGNPGAAVSESLDSPVF
jgi:hypothetical protein